MYIGIDIGGTNIRVASFETLSSPLGEIIKFDTQNNYDKDLANIKDAVSKLVNNKLEGIGVGVAAFLDKNKNQIINANNINNWNGRNLKSDLENIFNCKVLVENDATVAALGEAKFGKGIGLDDFLYITWGTGIGGTFIRRFGGNLLPTSSQLGHQIIEKDGNVCSCGQKGCWEAYCGGWAIHKNYCKHIGELSEEEWNNVEQNFVRGLINTLSVCQTKTIVFSGSVALNQKIRIEKIMELVKNELKMIEVPKFEFSDLGEKAELLGTTVLF